MKKFLLLLGLTAASMLSVNSAKVWLWYNGQYTTAELDSVTFSTPDEEILPSEDTTKQDTSVVTPTDTTKKDTTVTPSDTTKNDTSVVTPTDTTKKDTVVEEPFTVAGDYSGTIAVTVMGSTLGSSADVATLTAENDSTYTVKLSDFKVASYSLTDFVIDSVSVTGPDASGNYKLSRSTFSTTVGFNGNSEAMNNCSLTGTLKADGSLSATITFTPTDLPFPCTATFSGSK